MSTIVGLATALSSSAVNIIRISGDKSLEIAEKIFHTKKELNPNEIKYGFIKYDGEIYDEVLVSFMKAPKSFTGEDIIEINCHGGRLITNKILNLVVSLGARVADHGEFTKRAFINGKIDLTKAESIVDLIYAKSDIELKCAINQKLGKLYNKLKIIKDDILNIILPAVNTILVVFMVVMIILMKKRLKERYDASILKIEKEEEERKILFENTKKEAEALKKELLLEAKEDAHRLRMEVEKESRERRTEIQRLERRLLQREETLDKKSDMLDKKERELSLRASEVDKLEENIKEIDSQKRQELEIISNMSSEEAKTFLLNEIKKEITYESAVLIKEFETKLKEESENKAKEIITGAIQRYAADHVSESTVHVVALPNDEMKGRIIGREGRNIRTLEMLTGVDLIIDDTPEAVVLSSFDPVRREIAKIALERLVLDGRIHPTKIEEMVERAKRDIENEIKETGEQSLFDKGFN